MVILSPKSKAALRSSRCGLAVLVLAGGIMTCLSMSLFAADEPDRPTPPLKLYNDGTSKLRDGKLQEAEACLEAVVASQNDRLQSPALYNLGETRFEQGSEELKKGPGAPSAGVAASRASELGGNAIKAADAALAGDDTQALISAYLQGRGARKELKAATEAVKRALETHGKVLEKWNRSAGDFKGSYELSPDDTDSKTNADLVDRQIAKLVDEQQKLKQLLAGIGEQKSELSKKMAALKKKMPGSDGDQFKGPGDGDDEDENGPPKFPEGMEQADRNEGKEIRLTMEEATRMLQGLKLDSDRRLPMGDKETGKPGDRKGRDW